MHVPSLWTKQGVEIASVISGSSELIVGLSNILNHTQNNQHFHAMSLLRKRSAEVAGLDPLSSTRITKAFNNLPDEEREEL